MSLGDGAAKQRRESEVKVPRLALTYGGEE